MMILDPVNAVTSVGFYKRVAAQAVSRTIGYIAYVACVFSLVATVALKLRAGPEIDKTFSWLEKSMPVLTLSNGRMSSNPPAPITIRHPDDPRVAITIDTARVDPVTPQMLADQKIMAYVAANALYVMRSPGELRVFDFSTQKMGKPLVIGANFFDAARLFLDRILYPVVLAIIFIVFAVWKILTSFLYSLLGLLANASFSTGLPYGSLFSIAVYSQTLMIVLQAAFLFMPRPLPAPGLISILLSLAYTVLAVKKIKESGAAAPA